MVGHISALTCRLRPRPPRSSSLQTEWTFGGGPRFAYETPVSSLDALRVSGRLFGGGEAEGEGVEAANAAGLVGGSRKLFPLPHSHNFAETVRHVAGVDLQSTSEASPAIPHGPITAEDHLANYLSRDYDLLHRPEPAQLESTFGATGATFTSSYSVCYGIV